MRSMKKLGLFALALVGLSAGGAFATDPFADLITAVDFSTVTTDVVSVAALVVAVLVALRGIRWIYQIIRR